MMLPSKVIEALSKGRKTEAIALLRGERHIGMKQAKEMVEAYQRNPDAHAAQQTDDAAQLSKTALPDQVVAALRNGRKIEAIALLREMEGVGLEAAKAMVEAHQGEHPAEPREAPRHGEQARKRPRSTLLTLAVAVCSFVWAMVNVVSVVGSIIVLMHVDGYRKTTFTIEKLHHYDDYEAGLTWGFTGRLPDRNGRLYAPSLADAKSIGYRDLQAMFPPGTQMEVWHNPQVTDTLFQHRTLRVIPYTPDLAASELKQIMWWGEYCLLPLLLVLIFSGYHLRRARPD